MKAKHAARTRTAFLLVTLVGCGPRPEHERVVIEYVTAIRTGDCEQALALLSGDLRASVLAEENAQERERQRGMIAGNTVRDLYCSPGPYERVQLRKTRTARLSGHSADVHLIEAIPAGHVIPGFWPTRTDLESRPIRVVLETGQWKIDDAHVSADLQRRARARQERDEAERRARERNARRGLPPRPRNP